MARRQIYAWLRKLPEEAWTMGGRDPYDKEPSSLMLKGEELIQAFSTTFGVPVPTYEDLVYVAFEKPPGRFQYMSVNYGNVSPEYAAGTSREEAERIVEESSRIYGYRAKILPDHPLRVNLKDLFEGC